MAILSALLVTWGALAGALPAHADTTGRHITRYDATVDVAADGVATVRLDFDFDFGDDPGHGPYLVITTRQSVDSEHDRLFPVSDVTAQSPTAPVQIDRENDGNAEILRIGDPDKEISGVHTYTVQYTIDGLINAASQTGVGDELYWNVIGSGWEIPLAHVTTTVTGPADVVQVGCFSGPGGATGLCDAATSAGPTASFAESDVPVGDQFSIVTGWPAGTFPGVTPILTEPLDPLAPLKPTPLMAGLALLVAGGGTALAVSRVRRTGRDRAYLGLTPGLVPAAGQDGATGYRSRRTPVAVQFTPPQGVHPGELGTILDEKADPRDVTATIIDLAVRGFLRIEEVPPKRAGGKVKDWTLVELDVPRAGLSAPERLLLDEIFDGRTSVALSDLRTTFAGSMAKVQSSLYTHVTEKGWFAHNPHTVRTAWVVAGCVLLAVGGFGVVLAMASEIRGLALVAVGLLVVGIVVVVLARMAPARTAAGTAVLAEAVGFQRYLTTAEANQIRFEEGQDIFSRYLPYAIVFGVAERWSEIFDDLVAQGVDVPAPGWYAGSALHPGVFLGSYAALGSSLESFATVATSSLTAANPGSSGASGFGGGGFSGGGVGGGGGGGW